MMDSTEKLANFIQNTNFDDIPVGVITRAKQAILDTFGVMLAGCKEQAGRTIGDLVEEMGGQPEATIVGRGFRTSVAQAALVNGTCAHVLDYDDRHSSLRGHPSAPLVPVLLALGETTRARGRDLLVAYVVAFEVQAKLGRALNIEHYERGWHATATLGTMGAAACAAKIMELNCEQTRMALGIAASKAAGIRQNFGTMTKSLHVGSASQNGVVSAMLAEKGFTAGSNILEGSFGFCNVFCGDGNYDLQVITKNLGQPYEIISPGVCQKLYPCCAGSHRALDAIFDLIRQYDISVDQVQAVDCGVPYLHPQVLSYHNPRNALEAKFSMEFVMAVALLDRKVGLEQFTDDKIRSNRVQEVMRKVHMYVHPDQRTKESLESEFALVTVKIDRGKEYSQRVATPKGYPENPLQRDELLAKFLSCAMVALPAPKIERSMELLEDFEQLDDVTELMDLAKAESQ